MQAAVFLDRDNTIIHNDGDLGDPAKVQLIQGAASAIASLCGLGYKIVVVTNQGGVARGKYAERAVHAVHKRIDEMVHQTASGARIDAFYYCPYHPQGTVEEYRTEHPWRKPQPGMLLQAAADLSLDLARSWMIGDQMRDVQAGAAAGCCTILLHDSTNASDPEKQKDAIIPDAVAPNLIEAVRIIAQQRKPELAEEIARPALGSKRWNAAAVAELQKQRPAPRRTKTSDKNPAADTPHPTDKALENAIAAQIVLARLRLPSKTLHKSPPSEPASRPLEQDREQSPADHAPTSNIPEEPRHRVNAEPPKDAPPPPSAPGLATESGSETLLHVGSKSPDSPPNAAADESSTNRTLRLILKELRHQRESRAGDFSSAKMLALVFQVLAGLCLLGGLYMGAGEDELGLFLRWTGAALVFQGATISALLFGR